MKKLTNLELQQYYTRHVASYLMKTPTIAQEVQNLFDTHPELKNKVEVPKSIDTQQIGVKTLDKWAELRFMTALQYLPTKKEQDEWLLSMLKKANNRVYNYAQQNKQYNPFALINYLENRPRVRLTATDNDYTADIYFLTHSLIYPNDLDMYSRIDTLLLENILISTMTRQEMRQKGKKIIQDRKCDVAALEFYRKLTGKKWRNNEILFVQEIMQQIEDYVVSQRPRISMEIIAKHDTRVAYKYAPLNYLRAALSIPQTYGLDNTYTFNEVQISKEDWITLYGLMADPNKEIPEADYPVTMANMLVIYAFQGVYLQLEEAFWKTQVVGDIEEITEAELKLAEAQQQFEKEQKQAEIQLSKRLEKEKSLYEARIRELEQKLVSTEQLLDKQTIEIEELTQKNQTVDDLVNALFTQEIEENLVTDSDAEVASKRFADLVSEKRLVLIGGHKNFHNKLKEVAPSLYCLTPDDLSIGESQIKNADGIIFVTSYNNHGQFYRVQKLRNTSQRLLFLNQAVNRDNAIAELLRQWDAK